MEIEREKEQIRETNEVRKSMLDASGDHDETEAEQKNDRLECTRTPDRIIRKPNIEVKELTLGSRDRMSMVMEEDEDSFDLNNTTSAEEFDAILVRNSVVTEDDSMDICSMGLVAEDLFNDRRRSVTPNNLVFFPAAAGIPDVDEVNGGGVADEVENHKSMGERWGETNYATVLRQSVPMPPQKPQYEDSFNKVISIRTAPEGSSSPSEATPQNDPPAQVPDSRPLEELPEATKRLCESSVCTEAEKTIEAIISKSIPEHAEGKTEAEKTIEAIISKSIPEHAVGKITPNKTHFINRCFVCNSPVYTLEAICVIGRIYHKQCFRCQKCQRVLSVGNYSVGEGNPYCQPHYKEIFRVIGRYQGASMNNYNEVRLHESAVQSGTSSETDLYRPPPQLTRTLVAKFQQMCSDSVYPIADGRLSSIGSERQYNGNARSSTTCPALIRSSQIFSPVSPTLPVPTPFQQASQLMGVTQRNGSMELVVNTPTPANSDRPPLVRSATDENDLPNPGITRNMVAKFSALYAT